MGIKRQGVIILLLIYLLSIPVGSVSAAVLQGTSPDSYGTRFYESSLSGYMTASQQFFEIEDYWNVGRVRVNLDYKASQLMKSEQSSITLVMNGTPFHSFRPVVSDTVKQHLSVEIPIELILKGTNTLSIEGSLQTTDSNEKLAACVVTQTKDKWLHIYESSSISVQYTNEAMDKTISDFNRHFLGLDTVSKGLNAISVPAQSDPVELEAAAYALSGLARGNPLKDKAIPILVQGASELEAKKTIVSIALFDHLTEETKSLLGREVSGEEALIQLVNANTQPTLVVTSSNPELLVKAGRFVANQAMMMQLQSSSKVITEETEVDTPGVSISRTMALTETGDKLTGAMHREKSYFISLPGNRSIADASKVSIDYRYARNLDFDRSMITVLINGEPIGSKKLSTELADKDSISLPIPKTMNISGNFSVTVAFDLELSNTDCVQNQDQMPWAFIDKESLLQVNTKDKAELLFNNYPYPFLRDGSFNRIAVVLPSSRDAQMYGTIANLFNLLGQYAQTNMGEIQFYEDQVNSDVLKDRQIIAVGSYKDNKIIRESNRELYFQYDPSGEGFLSNEKISIDTDYGRRIGVLQLIDSPYSSGNGLLAVTGASSESIYMASRLLANDTAIWRVYGDGVAVDKDGNINAFRFKKDTVQEEPSVIADVLERSDVLSFMIAAILVLLLVLLSLILLVRKYRKKRGGER